ncbi:hypothetical protein PSPO01_15465 [Paraphaeosphaeria sporulosa]
MSKKRYTCFAVCVLHIAIPIPGGSNWSSQQWRVNILILSGACSCTPIATLQSAARCSVVSPLPVPLALGCIR